MGTASDAIAREFAAVSELCATVRRDGVSAGRTCIGSEAAAEGAEPRVAELIGLLSKAERQKALLAEQLQEIEADQARLRLCLNHSRSLRNVSRSFRLRTVRRKR
jgi:hypothetical protein